MGAPLWWRPRSPVTAIRSTDYRSGWSERDAQALALLADEVAGGHWFRNPGEPRRRTFDRIVFDDDLRAVHDLVAADLRGSAGGGFAR